MASLPKLLSNWNWYLCSEQANTWILLCSTVTFTVQCFSIYEYFYQQEKRLFKTKSTFVALQICIFLMSIVNMFLLGATDEYLFGLSNALSFMVLVWSNCFIYFSLSHILTVDYKMKKIRKIGVIVFAILIVLMSVVVVLGAFYTVDRKDRLEVFTLFFVFLMYALFCCYFPANQIKLSKDNDDINLISACMYYLLILIVYNLFAVVLIALSKFGNGDICDKGMYLRLLSPITALFVHTGQHPVPTFFKWLVWKKKEISQKLSSKMQSRGGVTSANQRKSMKNEYQGSSQVKSIKSVAILQ